MVFIIVLLWYTAIAIERCRCCPEGQHCEEDSCDCESCIQNDSQCLTCKLILQQLRCNITSEDSTSQNTKVDRNNVTTDEITRSTLKDEERHTTTARDLTTLADGRLNAKTRWYIFTWVSIFVIFLIGIGIWSSYKAWRKHKLQTRELDKCLELTSPVYLPVKQLGHTESTTRGIGTQNADSALYMELDDVSDTDTRNKNQNHAVGGDYTDLKQPLPKVRMYTVWDDCPRYDT